MRPFVITAALLHGALRLGAQSTDTLHLADLQQVAIARDPRAAQRTLLREQSALRVRNLSAERLPVLGLTSQAQYQSDITHFALPGAIAPYKDTYDANVTLRLRVVDPSRTRRTAVEEAQLAENEARLSSSLYAQRQDVNDAWFGALLYDAQLRVVDAAIAGLQGQLRVARDRVTAGAALPSDTAILQAELARRRQSADEASSGRDASRAVLAQLTGRLISPTVALAPTNLAASVRSARAAAEPPKTRPEYTQFIASRATVAAREAAASAQLKPRLSLLTRTGYGRPGLNMLARQFDTYWLGGIQLEWAPLDWGIAQREREAIAVQRDLVATEERAFAERMERSATMDLARIDRLERAIATDNDIVALRERVLAEARLRLNEGVITAAEFVERDTELASAKLTQAMRRVELEQARARYLTTLGLEVR